MGDVISLEKIPKKRGRPPNRPSPLEEVLTCQVPAKATKKQRQRVFLETIATTWSVRKACAAAGVDRRTAMAWQREPRFLEEFYLAQDAFAELMEEHLIFVATSKSAGRGERTRLQAMQAFLAVNHASYRRSRQEAAMRSFSALSDNVMAILAEHVDERTLQTLRDEFARAATLLETSGGLSAK